MLYDNRIDDSQGIDDNKVNACIICMYHIKNVLFFNIGVF